MKRRLLLELLNAYVAETHEEMLVRERMQAFVHAHEDCFERTLTVGHITASAWLISNDGERALLTHHAKLNKWLQLGGHCDGDHDVLRVALREAQEESGIQQIIPVISVPFDIDIHPIPATAREAAHYHYDVRFLLKVASDEVAVPNHETRELRWISKKRSDLPTDSESMVRMFRKWIAH